VDLRFYVCSCKIRHVLFLVSRYNHILAFNKFWQEHDTCCHWIVPKYSLTIRNCNYTN
jgi:hypothetical protein